MATSRSGFRLGVQLLPKRQKLALFLRLLRALPLLAQ